MEVLVDILCLCSLAKDEENLRIFERRILWKIHSPTCENYVWRIKLNDELCLQFL
jgi:hypothetical protein